ncbi:acyl-CoA dehydrogenase family protein [Novosphingobium taihuense]|uniref:Acyl-CoA dehydrogenase/oxidase C-terminal domain-containing protein n=1 Tax=Novosphingobium taihuense TaxID=260085 RepID=A0A7W7AE95_9SPHN|nr:acyl-CoA dehydrogenase family protein [Novosphingobium taihuense]MBB4615418.1 hypothetical protein [Novosphingobium taihuense]TWH82134.1 acyl-CoA dehydrogenase-like protein [Novosphingobium taihuense]
MDLDFTPEQQALLAALARMVDDNCAMPTENGVVAAVKWARGVGLECALEAGGFLDVALAEGCGALEAALLVAECGRSPLVVETAGSALIGPLLAGRSLSRPVAVARAEDLTRGVRFLDTAKTLIVLDGEDAVLLRAGDLDVIPLDGPYAWPLGRLATGPDLSSGERLAGRGAELERLWRLGLALEAGAALRAAIDFTNDYVKQRMVFGRPVGSFQAVQHRLSIDAVRAEGVRWLALKAAWSGDAADAALAALHAQRSILQVVYDCHQFNGALGMTLEHALHFWTFRLRWLVGELGGWSRQAASAAELIWPDASAA